MTVESEQDRYLKLQGRIFSGILPKPSAIRRLTASAPIKKHK
jgi:hypothetical protein